MSTISTSFLSPEQLYLPTSPLARAHHRAAQNMRQGQLRQLHRHGGDQDPQRLVVAGPGEAWRQAEHPGTWGWGGWGWGWGP